MTLIRKAVANSGTGLDFVLSDATSDRYGDTIDPAGWDLKWFKKNPIALFGHSSSFPIGTWQNVRVEGGKLIATLKLAARGTSARIDELIGLVEQSVLRAVSVGFIPRKSEPVNPEKPYDGVRYVEQELLECSLVTVPANPAALLLAKSMSGFDEIMSLAFGETAETVLRDVSAGEKAKTPPAQPSKRNKAMTLAQRIEAAQAAFTKASDDLNNHVAGDDLDPAVTEELSRIVEETKTALTGLQRAEQALAINTSLVRTVDDQPVDARRPFAKPAIKVAPKDYVFRSAVVQMLHHVTKRPHSDILKERYGEDQLTRAVFDVVTRSASAPATTTTTGWAAELVQTSILDFIESLLPFSVYPGLAERGGRFTFGRNGVVTLPARNLATSLGGSFVAQGAPIPVRQGAFTSTSLTPKKMAVISTFTREIAEHSTPSIEAILREAIQEDTAIAIDTVLLDATAASTTRPAGLRNGVTVTTATSGGGFAALIGDLKNLIGAVLATSNGQLRKPVWIMNPVQALAASVTQNAGGDFPFAEDIAKGMLLGYPLLLSTTVTAGMVFFVDAADFFSATGDEPRFDMSDQATLHMEDTTPLAIGTTGTPNVVAAPVRSLFQTDSIALRMIMDLNWAMRRAGTVAWTQSVTW